ncbi:hypothetical protein GCM10007160_28120 [Litchfieldella qijiaojingensis]|uniref:2OG-Fe dioxygenase family protein n=1 Tax=Litchfieldella qijiaojingensis TaxID=980347 RepID=A0ABQ2YZX4_9GAMM|nr:2OG-Fe dioxygenase family protein [Halomonas qijiaojingensis]GGX98770.1 hypothetical protein GCM10007160_28120 [Halomonas qijiaojingensis]
MHTPMVQPQKLFSAHVDYLRKGYCVVDMPVMPRDVLESFDNMPRDFHSLGRLRQIRLSQYIGFWDESEWVFAVLPQRKYIQSARYIKLEEAGGIPRHREQLEVDPSPLIARVLDNLPIEQHEMVQINVNQIRVTANAQYRGVTVPEGPHRDGHEYSVIAVVRRENVIGGETQVIDPLTNEVVHRQVLEENQAIIIDDERYIHYATDIEPATGELGYRDIWVIEINRWENRAYGRAHEREAMASGS